MNNKKIMVSVFFTKAGIISVNYLDKNTKANASWYKDKCLKTGLNKWKNTHKKTEYKKILLHDENGPINISKL